MNTAYALEIGKSFNPYQSDDTFSPVPNWLMSRPEVSFGAKCLYGRLRQYSGKNGLICPKLETLSYEMGTSERNITRLLNELRKHCLIRSIRRGLGQSNLYELLTHIWMYQRGEPVPEPEKSIKSCPDRSVSSDWTNPSTHTFKRKNQKKTTAPAAVVSLPDDSQTKDMLDLIPADVPVSDGIQRIIKAHLAKSGQELVRRNIEYTNAHIRDKMKYRAYLDKSLREDWGIDFDLEKEKKKQAKENFFSDAIAADTRAREDLLQGIDANRKRADLANRFLALPENDREKIRAKYLHGCNAYMRRKSESLDHAGLAKTMGFRLFLEDIIRKGGEIALLDLCQVSGEK